MQILKFSEYSNSTINIVDFFANSLNTRINESQNEDYESISKKLSKDLKLNLSSVTKFGVAITAFYPIVTKLINNSQIKVEDPIEASVLLTICAFSIIHSDDAKLSEDDKFKLKNQCKSMLEELKLRGIGNGIVKKIIACIRSIFKLFKIIAKHMGSVVVNILDMFAFTTLLLPILNAIMACIGKYSLTIDTLSGNLLSIGVGVGTLVVKNIVINTLKKLNKSDKAKEIIGDTSHDVKKFGDADLSGKNLQQINEKD